MVQMAVHMGAEKAKLSWWKTFWLGNLAGFYLSFGGALLYFVGGQIPEITTDNPGLASFIKGFIGLPMGLAFIVICGAELYTANVAFLPAAFYEGKATVSQLLKNWFWSFFGNLTGSLFIVWMVDATYLITPGGKGPINSKVPIALSIQKTSEPWGVCLCRAFLCNWLVNLAVWQATAAQDVASKILAVLFPVGAFVAIGFEHVVANMFLIPYGMKLGSKVSVGHYIWKSMIPCVIGNTLSAAFFLAGSYAMCYGTLPQRISNLITSRTREETYSGRPNDDSAHSGGMSNPTAGKV